MAGRIRPDKFGAMKNDPTPSPERRKVPHEEIARRAEKLWRDRNCPAGSDDAIWLEAETQLQGEADSRPVAGTPSRPYQDEPATPVRSQTKSRDPADAAAQLRSGNSGNAKPGTLRNQ